jgi:hypothetical protein
MKTQILFIVFFFSAFALLNTGFAQLPNIPVSADKSAIIEDNYLAGLESDNRGLKVSCAFFLGDAGSEKSVIPLMKMLSESEDRGEKFVAAWSLLKIGDERGVYRVKMEAEKSDCNQLRCILDYLYKDYRLEKFGKAF